MTLRSCLHCDRDVNVRVYRDHRQLYFNKHTQQWRVLRDGKMFETELKARQARESARGGASGPTTAGGSDGTPVTIASSFTMSEREYCDLDTKPALVTSIPGQSFRAGDTTDDEHGLCALVRKEAASHSEKLCSLISDRLRKLRDSPRHEPSSATDTNLVQTTPVPGLSLRATDALDDEHGLCELIRKETASHTEKICSLISAKLAAVRASPRQAPMSSAETKCTQTTEATPVRRLSQLSQDPTDDDGDHALRAFIRKEIAKQSEEMCLSTSGERTPLSATPAQVARSEAEREQITLKKKKVPTAPLR